MLPKGPAEWRLELRWCGVDGGKMTLVQRRASVGAALMPVR